MDNIDNVYSLFNISLPKLFLKKIEEINAIYGQQQIENINTTLSLIREYINIKHRTYASSDDEEYDNFYDIKQNDISRTSNIPITPATTIDDTDVATDLVDSNMNTYASPPSVNTELRFSFLRSPKFKLRNKEQYGSDSDNKSSSSNDGEEVLCSTFKNTKFQYLSSSDKFTNKITALKNINIQKSVNWCNKYSFTMNKHFVNN